MHVKKQAVKLKGKKLCDLEIQQADSLAEAATLFGSEAEVLRLANRQFATDAMNNTRREATPSGGKKKLRQVAFSLIPKEDLENLIQTTEPLKLQDAINKLVEDYMDEAEQKLANGEVTLDDVLQ